MADAGPHRHARAGHGAHDRLAVEGRQIGPRPTAAGDDDHVETGPGGLADRPADRSRRPLSLHPRIEHQHPEGQARAVELVEEVVGGRAAERGHQSDPQRRGAQRQRAVALEEPLGHQPPQQQFAVGRQPTERVGGVDETHHQLQLTGRGVQLEGAAQAHLHPVGHAHRTAGPPQDAVDEVALLGEERHGQPRRGGPAELAGVAEVEVDVARGRPLQVVDLAPDPDLARGTWPARRRRGARTPRSH